ncbi:MAG: glycosyltransferase, partial [Candidatus Eisenbacteria bacterium]
MQDPERVIVPRTTEGSGASSCGPPIPSGPPAAPPLETEAPRPSARGKFIYAGEEKLLVRGVTYGPFRPRGTNGDEYDFRAADRDFARMAAVGVNTVRTYTTPPLWLLDLARKHGLRVLAGLSWEDHVAFLEDRDRMKSIRDRVRAAVRSCAAHPALFGFTIGNEIPAPIVRWYGRRRVERFLKSLHETAKEEDPGALVTYVNYPTTEYLQLPFLDLFTFNVYLESPGAFGSYLSRLQNIAGERPLLMAEIGLDSRRNGEEKQAEAIEWQARAAFAAGCAGVFVFSWTDEWHRGGQDIEDWDFGLTDREHNPKPSLNAVRRVFSEIPFPPDTQWPAVSVVVCTHNGEKTIRRCCESLMRLEYPSYEVIAVDDGSTDGTPAILGEFPFRVVRKTNGGLSRARNTGIAHARGEIVAFIDDDAYPDPHWLQYLARSFLEGDHAGVGGPNILPPESGMVAECVSHSPGGPTHVLVSDEEAEHIPGCNMAFRKAALEEIAGFDPRFVVAGDDVDLCWRLQRQGYKLGFSHGAVVWHYRRDSAWKYLKQQMNYGRAEAMLEVKWPEKYNVYGHVPWGGRLYGNGGILPGLLRRWRVYHGVWGSGLFQSLYTGPRGFWRDFATMPESYLLLFALMVVSMFGFAWKPLLAAVPFLLLAAVLPAAHAFQTGRHSPLKGGGRSKVRAFRSRCLIGCLTILQPLVRLAGRVSQGLTPLRRLRSRCFTFPRVRVSRFWSEEWRSLNGRLQAVEAAIRGRGAHSVRGGEHDRWDLEVREGAFGAVRILSAIEEHGGGRQMVRFRSWPVPTVTGVALAGFFGGLSTIAIPLHHPVTAILFGAMAVGTGVCVAADCASATNICLGALHGSEQGRSIPDSSRNERGHGERRIRSDDDRRGAPAGAADARSPRGRRAPRPGEGAMTANRSSGV